MQKILKITEELRRRAQGKVDMTGPAKMMLKVSESLPVKAYPSSFRGFLDAMDDQLKQLPRTKDHRTDYHALVDTCVACHRYYASRTADAMRMLRLADVGIKSNAPRPKDDWVEPKEPDNPPPPPTVDKAGDNASDDDDTPDDAPKPAH